MILTKIDSIIIIKNNFEIIAISKIDAIIITMMFIKLMRIIMTFVFIIIIIMIIMIIIIIVIIITMIIIMIIKMIITMILFYFIINLTIPIDLIIIKIDCQFNLLNYQLPIVII